MKSPLEIIAGGRGSDMSDAEFSTCIAEIDPVVRNLLQQGISVGPIVAALALAQLTVLTAEQELGI